MNTALSGIYYASAHGLYRPTKDLPVISHLVTNYYAIGFFNVTLCKNNPLPWEVRGVISFAMTCTSYTICHFADDERVTTFFLHVPASIAAFSASRVKGTFSACALLTMYCNSLLEFWPEKTHFKMVRVAIVHFSVLCCGRNIEKAAVVARYALYPFVGHEKGSRIIMGNLLEAGQTVWSMIDFQ